METDKQLPKNNFECQTNQARLQLQRAAEACPHLWPYSDRRRRRRRPGYERRRRYRQPRGGGALATRRRPRGAVQLTTGYFKRPKEESERRTK